MESFRKTLKTRVRATQCFTGLLLLMIIALNFYVPHEQTFHIGFSLGIVLCLEILSAKYMADCSKALKNDELMKAMYIKENDERSIYIKSKIGGVGLNIVTVGLGVGTIAAGFFNETVFYALFASLIFSVLVKFALKLYYKKKV